MTKKIVSLLLVCLMACSSVPLIFGNYTSAATGAANFLPNYFVTGLDTANEDALSLNIAQYITNLLSSRSSYTCYTRYDARVNDYNTVLREC
jgi:hypothetical protein